MTEKGWERGRLSQPGLTACKQKADQKLVLIVPKNCRGAPISMDW